MRKKNHESGKLFFIIVFFLSLTLSTWRDAERFEGRQIKLNIQNKKREGAGLISM